MAGPRRVRVTGCCSFLGDGIAALLGFEDEPVSAIQVNEVGRGGAAEFLKVDHLVDDGGVESLVGLTGVGLRKVEQTQVRS